MQSLLFTFLCLISFFTLFNNQSWLSCNCYLLKFYLPLILPEEQMNFKLVSNIPGNSVYINVKIILCMFASHLVFISLCFFNFLVLKYVVHCVLLLPDEVRPM